MHESPREVDDSEFKTCLTNILLLRAFRVVLFFKLVHAITEFNTGQTLDMDVQMKLTFCIHAECTGVGGGGVPQVF